MVPGTAEAYLPPPPAALHLDPFYHEYIDADGIPIVASDKVEDRALEIARDIVIEELAFRPDIRKDLVANGARVGIMAQSETTMDLPEQRDWQKPAINDPRLTSCERRTYAAIAAMTAYQYWAQRARGMGGLYTTAAAENLLAIPGTRYFGETILIHEFSHAILESVERIDPVLYARVAAAYSHASRLHLWDGDYAGNTIQEYWAEGTQFWFNSNKVSRIGDHVIASDQDLKAYDPDLYRVLAAVYGRNHHISADPFYNSPARYDSRSARHATMSADTC